MGDLSSYGTNYIEANALLEAQAALMDGAGFGTQIPQVERELAKLTGSELAALKRAASHLEMRCGEWLRDGGGLQLD